MSVGNTAVALIIFTVHPVLRTVSQPPTRRFETDGGVVIELNAKNMPLLRVNVGGYCRDATMKR